MERDSNAPGRRRLLAAGLFGLLLVVRPPSSGAVDESDVISAYRRVADSVCLIMVEGLVLEPEEARVSRVEGAGSGFAIEPGLVVTNYHVIGDALRIEVHLQSGRSAAAKLVGTAPGYDLALLRVPFDEKDLPPVDLGSGNELEVGQTVLALSHPLGLQHSISAGIVSGLNRELPGTELGASLIQFDAAINPGQSGGPLVDLRGRVVGVTTAKVLGAEAIGFAIPAEIVAAVVPDLKRMGHPFRLKIGIQGVPLTPDLAQLFDLPVDWGILVEKVETGSAADRLGLEPGHRHIFLGGHEFVLGGDIIVGVDDTPIRGPNDLTRLLLTVRPGGELHLAVVGPRGHRKLTLKIPEMDH